MTAKLSRKISRTAAPVDLLHLLFGDILTVSWKDVTVVWVGGAVVLLVLAIVIFVKRAAIANALGYLTSGIHVDAEDWRESNPRQIVRNVLDERHKGNVVLLHDGGGDREQTVQALPAIIDGLQRQGYRFVSVAQLAGLKHDQVMPELSGVNLLEVRADVFAFSLAGFIVTALNWVFFFAIALGIIRAVGMAVLATRPARRPVPQPDSSFCPKVTVIVPAGIAPGAVYCPEAEIVPTVEFPPVVLLTCQVTAVFAVPVTEAVNCCVALTASEADAGEMLTATGLTGAVIVTVVLPDLVGSA